MKKYMVLLMIVMMGCSSVEASTFGQYGTHLAQHLISSLQAPGSAHTGAAAGGAGGGPVFGASQAYNGTITQQLAQAQAQAQAQAAAAAAGDYIDYSECTDQNLVIKTLLAKKQQLQNFHDIINKAVGELTSYPEKITVLTQLKNQLPLATLNIISSGLDEPDTLKNSGELESIQQQLKPMLISARTAFFTLKDSCFYAYKLDPAGERAMSTLLGGSLDDIYTTSGHHASSYVYSFGARRLTQQAETELTTSETSMAWLMMKKIANVSGYAPKLEIPTKATLEIGQILGTLITLIENRKSYLLSMHISLEEQSFVAGHHAAIAKGASEAAAAGKIATLELKRLAQEQANTAALTLVTANQAAQAAADEAKHTELKLKAATEAAAAAAQLELALKTPAAQAQAQIDIHNATKEHAAALKAAELAADKAKAIAELTIEGKTKKELAAAKLKAEREQLADTHTARSNLVRNTLMGLTGAGLLGMAAYFGLRHYYMPRPTIIERADTSMLSPLEKLRGFKVPASNLDSVVLSPDLHKKVLDKFIDITKAIESRMPLSNMMFFGPAGTGKTMAAQAFCRRLHEQKLANHVIIRGPAFKRLGSAPKAQEALADILRWANQSKLPVVLVFDEAEALFADRASEFANEMTNDLVTTMLSFFERAISDKMMFIFATNYPSRVDKALLNRIDPSNIIRFTPPGEAEIKMLLDSYLQQHILDRNFGVSPEISSKKSQLAQKMNGLVGRQIDSLIAQTLYKMIGRKRQELDLQTLEEAIADATRKQDYSAY